MPGRDRKAVPYDQPQRAGVNHARLRQATKWAMLHLDVTIARGARHSAKVATLGPHKLYFLSPQPNSICSFDEITILSAS